MGGTGDFEALMNALRKQGIQRPMNDGAAPFGVKNQAGNEVGEGAAFGDATGMMNRAAMF